MDRPPSAARTGREPATLLLNVWSPHFSSCPIPVTTDSLTLPPNEKHPRDRRVAQWLGIAALAVSAVIAVMLLGARHRAQPVRAANVAGDAVCLECHREKASF